MKSLIAGNAWRETLPTLELALALIAAALWYTTGGAVWYRETGIGLWPVLLLLPLWPLHRLARGRRAGLSGMGLWMIVFLLTACVSVWVSYDRQIALAKLGLLLGAAGVGTAMAHQSTRRQIYITLAVLALAGVGLSLYSLMSSDWAAQEAKYTQLAQIGRAVSGLLPVLSGHRITPNVVGGMLAVLVPLIIPLLTIRAELWTGFASGRAGRAGRALWGIGLAVMLLALVLSASRGAWLGLAGALAGWGLWRWLGHMAGRYQSGWKRRVGGFLLFVLAGITAALIAGYVILLFELPGSDALANRLRLLSQGLDLAQDYPYTGVGLGLFTVPFSVYTLWIHVGYIVYSHNTFVDLLVEQGAVGLVSLLLLWGHGLSCFARYRARASRGLGLVMEAAVASWATLVLHGFADDVLYGSRGVLLLFVPTGILLASAARACHEERRIAASEPDSAPALESPAVAAYPVSWLTMAVVGVVAVLLLTEGHPLTAWYANRGAIEQTRVELQLYDPERFAELEMDEVRRQVNLDAAIALLAQAATVPAHPTAPRRLAAIYLARGSYGDALNVMQASWDSGNRDDGTRLLYGDALVANGQPSGVAQVIRGVPFAVERLEGQAFSRYRANEEWEQLASAYAVIGRLTGDTENGLQRANDERERAGL
ncbi:MAG: O-antigen ligase family protein, partial [Anaerolineae bacterium]